MTSGHAYNHTMWDHFPTQQALASILLSQRSITQLCKIYEDVLHDEGCMADAVQDPGSNIYVKTYSVVTLLPWIRTPSFESSFSILFHYFKILSSKKAQDIGPYIWRSPESDFIHFMQVATFIMENWCIYTIWRYAPYRMGTGKDEFHSDTTEEGFIAIQCNNRFWGGVWSDMTIEQILARTKNGFWWAYMRVQKYREHLMGGCQFAYHCVPQLRSPMAARPILLRSIVRYITTKAWNQPNRQIWGIKHIRCFMDIIMAISFHCLLVSLMTPQLFVTMQRK